jgi:hypothetical protein
MQDQLKTGMKTTARFFLNASQKSNQVIFKSRLIKKYLSSEMIQGALLVSILILLLTNLGLWLSANRAQALNGYLAFGLLLVIVLASLAGLLAWLYYANRVVLEAEDVVEAARQRPRVPAGYHKIFSQPVDPIGNLYLWRITAEKQKKYLEAGPQIVEELENYLERHCDIYRIGAFGDLVRFDPDRHVFLQEADDTKGELAVPAKGARVKVIEPGWQWRQDQILRRPRVR